MPVGNVTRVSRLLSRSSVSSAVTPCGKSRSVSVLLPRIISLVRFVRPLGRKTLVSPLKLRFNSMRFVKVPGREKRVRRLESRNSRSRLPAASSPSTLLTSREEASRLIRLSRSCSVNGPLGCSKASRMAAFKPGSGICTSCARVAVTKLARTSRVRTSGRMRGMMVFMSTEYLCLINGWLCRCCWRMDGRGPRGSVEKSLVRQRRSNFLQQHFGSKRLLNEPVGYGLGKPQVSLAVAAGHQDSQSGMNHEALIHKLVNGHRKAAVVRDQEIRLFPVRSQGCQRLRAIVESPQNVARRFQQRGV